MRTPTTFHSPLIALVESLKVCILTYPAIEFYLSFQGFRRKINPEQIPSATEAIEFDRHQWENTTYLNLPGEHVPFSTSDFVGLDQG
jgi:hypothetical protein